MLAIGVQLLLIGLFLAVIYYYCLTTDAAISVI